VHTIKTLTLAFHKCLESILDPTPTPSRRLRYTWAFTHVWEYVRVVRVLVLNTLAAPFDETTWVLCLFHPLVKVDFPYFVDDFHHDTKVTLDGEAFVSVLARSPHLSSGGLSGMVYEYLWNYFVLDDFASGFNLFFEVCGHIVWGHVPLSISHLLFAFWFLTLEKQFGGICPITISGVTYCLVAHILAIQFRDIFIEPFGPYQFGVVICGRKETLVRSIWTMLDLHPNWVVLQVDVHNAFNSISRSVIF
jgi:hypothetical protein